FDRVQAPTLLMIGQKDTTAIGKDAAPAELKKKLGDYPRLGREAARRFPHAKLVAFPELVHAPHIQDAARFHEALVQGLRSSAHAALADDALKDFDNASWVLDLPRSIQRAWLQRIRAIRLADRLAENQQLDPTSRRFDRFVPPVFDGEGPAVPAAWTRYLAA